jgi:hypothetical protein
MLGELNTRVLNTEYEWLVPIRLVLVTRLILPQVTPALIPLLV